MYTSPSGMTMKERRKVMIRLRKKDLCVRRGYQPVWSNSNRVVSPINHLRLISPHCNSAIPLHHHHHNNNSVSTMVDLNPYPSLIPNPRAKEAASRCPAVLEILNLAS